MHLTVTQNLLGFFGLLLRDFCSNLYLVRRQEQLETWTEIVSVVKAGAGKGDADLRVSDE